MPKDKIAIVVQRSHLDVVGGSESLALQYAHLLKKKFDVHVLTTCAVDANRWVSVLSAGIEKKDGLTFHRFQNQEGHTPYWYKLHSRLNSDYKTWASFPRLRTGLELEDKFLPWPRSLEEEWVRMQGPHSPDLLSYIHFNHHEYKYFIFLTYLYSPTCFGLPLVPKEKTFLVPTLHDESAARLSIFSHLARSAGKLLWNTNNEKKFGDILWGRLPGKIVSMYVKTDFVEEESPQAAPYYLYLGRIEPGKGCQEMIDYHLRSLKEETLENNKSNTGKIKVKLILAGKLEMELPDHLAIDYQGFVSEEKKFNLIRHAKALIMPSPNESLSIVTLEAMAQKTPVISYKKNPVLQEHIDRSGCDFGYQGYSSFLDCVKKIDQGENEEALEKGRQYVLENYSKDVVSQRLLNELP